MKTYLSIFLGFLLTSLTGQGKELVKFPEKAGGWTVECSSPGEAPAKPKPKSKPKDKGKEKTEAKDPLVKAGPAVLEKVEIVQDGEKRRVICQWSDGRRREMWYFFGMDAVLGEDPQGRAFVSTEKTFPIPYGPDSFKWLKEEFLVEQEPVLYQGKKCHHYKGEVGLDIPGEEGASKTTYEAWIDSETFLPVGLSDGNRLGIFAFRKGGGDLVAPAKFQQKLDFYKTVRGIGGESPAEPGAGDKKN